MKEIITKSAIIGLIGVPVFIISVAVSAGVLQGVAKSIKEAKNVKQ